MKLLTFIVISVILTQTIFCVENHYKTTIKVSNEIKSSTNVENSANTDIQSGALTHVTAMLMRLPKVDLTNINFPKDAKRFYEGWVKFFHYNNGTHYKRPRAFFQNSEFFGQRILKSQKDFKDKKGLKRIPSQAHFYLVVYNNSLAFYNSRNRILMHLVDNLKIDFIKPIPEDKPTVGGIKELGKLNEGYCIEISVSVPNSYKENFTFEYKGKDQIWVICYDNYSSKSNLYKILLKLKVKRQRQLGKIATKSSLNNKSKNTLSSLFKRSSKKKGNRKPRDGKWILLQDWTKCTLSCGGGLSYKQFMCVPPKNGGKPCKGKAIRTRPCNTHKCPNIKNKLGGKKGRKGKNGQNIKKEGVKPIIKVLPFSTRPQRYSKCLLKESDAYVMHKNNLGEIVAKQPIRILMNNKTFSLYEDDSYNSNLYTYQLDNSLFSLSSKKCCFILKDNYKRYELCGFDSSCGSKNQWAQSWNNDFDLFKNQCKTGIKLLSSNDLRVLNEKFKNKLGRVKDDLINQKQKILNKKVKKKDMLILSTKINDAENMGLKVLSKELDIESLITKEEKEKEDLDLKNIFSQIQKEKGKKSCMEKKIKEKRLEGENDMDKISTEKDISKIKKDLALSIEIKRAEMKKKIDLMRRRAARRKAALIQKLTKVKSKMAQELMMANKKGSIKNCKKGKSNQKERMAYCNANFIDDIVKNTECKDKESFCYMCCENEFGEMFIKEREKCYNMCDNKKSSKGKSRRSSKKGNGKGKWVWKPKQVIIKNDLFR